jgi:Protein of unknown function (DUF2889)
LKQDKPMPSANDGNETRRRLMHTRSVECEGFLRADGLWEVEAWLRDTKPFTQRADRFRGELKPGEPVHDIGLRLAIDDSMTIREAEAMMRATPYPTCIEVEPILQRLIGERVGPGWREWVRRKIGEGRDTLENQQRLGERPFFIGGCHSWRTDGPVVAAMFPQFATKPAAKD